MNIQSQIHVLKIVRNVQKMAYYLREELDTRNAKHDAGTSVKHILIWF